MPESPQPLNPWLLKPWWCQPWSILLTGIGLIVGSWGLVHRWWVTLLVAIPVSLWMGFFLLIWPRGVIYAAQFNPPTPDSSASNVNDPT